MNNQTNSEGVGFLGLLFIVFLVLKLTHVINWSWWWITAPLWGGFALVIAFLLMALLSVTIIVTYKHYQAKAKMRKRIRN
jgi:membrane protein YdbS with pleckstrin-like domain